jgi:hypothetical protein
MDMEDNNKSSNNLIKTNTEYFSHRESLEHHQTLSIIHWNVQGVGQYSKQDEIDLFFKSFRYKPDFICLSEHWINADSLHLLHGFEQYVLAANYSRIVNKRGGVCILANSGVSFRSRPDFEKFNLELVFECCGIQIEYPLKMIILYLYRPPNLAKYVMNLFFEKLNCVLKMCRKYYPKYNIVIAGDFNINILVKSKISDEFLECLGAHLLCCHIDEPTRISSRSRTCIDNIVSSCNIERCKSGVLETGLSDHTLQYWILDLDNEVQKNNLYSNNKINHKYTRLFTQRNINTFKISLAEERWSALFEYADNTSDMNILYVKFLNILMCYFNAAFPIIKRRNNKKQTSDKRWVTAGIRISCARRRELHVLAKYTNDEAFKAYVRKYKKILCKCITTAKIFYNNNRISKSNNKTKTAWELVRNSTSIPSSQDKKIRSLLGKYKSHGDALKLINSHFIDLCTNLKLSPNLNEVSKIMNTLEPSRCVLVSFSPVLESEIIAIISEMRPSRAPGWDEIPPFILKQCSTILAKPISLLINNSFRTGKFPDLLKLSNVHLVFKKEDPRDINNYRPIVILSSISKIFETAVAMRLMTHLEKNKLLKYNQFGFRKGRNTLSAIFELLIDVVKSIDLSRNAIAAFCDLSRAFECVNHSLLLCKLKHYGINGSAYSWIESYLLGRRQSIQIVNMNKKSSYEEIRNGVPQGSVLGPLLFLIYVNDMPDVIAKSSKLIQYADDTTILITGSDKDILQQNLSHDLHAISNWCEANGLSLNLTKTQRLSFHSKYNFNSKSSSDVNAAEKIPNVARFLGITIDESLTWENHISELIKKLNKGYFVMVTLSRSLNKEALLMVYYAYIYSHISYGVVFWGVSRNSYKIFVMQKRIIRIIEKLKYRQSCRNSFRQLNILTFPCIYIYYTIQLVKTQQSHFTSLSSTHKYNTRNDQTLLYPNHRTTSYEKTFYYNAVKLYNRLPEYIKSCNDVKHFKKLSRKFLNDKCYYSIDDFLNDV